MSKVQRCKSCPVEQHLIRHCAPTLASIKTANLFNLAYENEECLARSIRRWNEILWQKGIALTILQKKSGRALIYVYRPDRLSKELKEEKNAHFLAQFGYQSTSLSGMLSHLSSRMEEGSFPHEIGIFLGYPLEDVESFICHGGRDCLFCGCWKVYHNKEQACRAFRQYDKCRDTYLRLWQEGKSLLRLTVAA